MSGFYFADLSKNRTTTTNVSVNYGAKYPVEKVITYNKFTGDDIDKLHTAMEDIKNKYYPDKDIHTVYICEIKQYLINEKE